MVQAACYLTYLKQQQKASSMASHTANLWVLLGLGIAGILLATKKLKKTVREDFGAFIDKLLLLPPPHPDPPKAPHPLTGLSFAVSDVFDITGYVTGFGHPDWVRTHEAASSTCPVVSTLFEGGATCVGKTVVDELAFSISGENKHYDSPTNPAAPARIPGGACSGAAVAVATSALDCALGIDTVGGVRVPAGFKSSHGAVSNQSTGSPPVQAASQPEKTPRERRIWTSCDDLVLISGWLYTSKDVIIGNDQRSGAFWKRIGDYYASSTHVLNGAEPRLPDHCRQRWQKLHKDVARFCGAYAHAVTEKASGMNDSDILKNAHQIYVTLYKKKFTLEYAWNELRYEQKWVNLEPMNPTPKTTSSNKRKADDAAPSSGSNVGEQESRPPGIKAMKAKRNKGQDKVGPAAASDNMWEKKQKDMDQRKELQKMSIYNTLLAKNETLDEDEKALKKKLMAELF